MGQAFVNYNKQADKIYPGINKNLSHIRWLQVLYIGGRGLATIDRLLTVSLVAGNYKHWTEIK